MKKTITQYMKSSFITFVLLLIAQVASNSVNATTYHVGPGQQYTTIGEVPWYSLVGGDSVLIHWKQGGYHEKFMISTRGSDNAVLHVIGVPNANGELPIIDGENATTGPNMHWKDNWGAGEPFDVESLGVVSIVPNNDGTSVSPAHIEIANLSIKNARSSNQYTGESGTVMNYDGFASAIYASKPQFLTIRNCEISNSHNGFFNSTSDNPGSNAWWDAMASNISIIGNYFHDCGSPNGGYTEHSIYSQADKILIEKNHFGPMLPGCGGNQIKDRSAGTIIRYNFIEGQAGARLLDLVENEDAGPTMDNLPHYGHDFVYGNLLLQVTGDQNSGIGTIHWNGDHWNGGRATKAGAKLNFYHNTWVYRHDMEWNPLPIFSVQDAGDNCQDSAITSVIDARNNIFYAYKATSNGTDQELAWASCEITNIDLFNNWVSPNVETCSWGACTGVINNFNTSISPNNNTPGFLDVNNYDVHLLASSSAIGVGAELSPEVTNNVLGLDLTPYYQYVSLDSVSERTSYGLNSDLGAYSFGTSEASLIANESELKFSLYPNPTDDILTLSLVDVNGTVSFQVLDASGREMLSKFQGVATGTFTTEINTQNLSSGLYVLVIQTTEGSLNKQFVVR